jgi:Na+/H+ antiporter NhaD/arsenite permease-like protein
VHQFLGSGKAEMVAISMGAVLFGAATYIGNSPNFIIKAIAEQHGMHTPSFIGFVTKVFSSHPLAGTFAGLLANGARLKVDRCSPV